MPDDHRGRGKIQETRDSQSDRIEDVHSGKGLTKTDAFKDDADLNASLNRGEAELPLTIRTRQSVI